MIAPGDVLRNRYRIERSIGRGGMGEVFAAVVLVPPSWKAGDAEATLLRPSPESFRVAIKVVSRAVVSDAAMARLQREAIAASRIKSAFVPELIEVSTTDDGEVFLAMEILYGDTLSADLKGRRCLPWDEAFLLGDDVLSGLIDAHEAGVVHRDLKPSNIFLCDPTPPETVRRAKVLDFGVCKLDTHDEEKLTGTGESVGTVAYMAPEQIRGASQVTERADLYSFGTVLFEALSGQLPHLGGGQMAMLASKLERNALRLSDAAQVLVPAALDPLLARLLARDPNKRFATAREVRDAWRALGPAVVEPRASSSVPPENVPLATETGLASGTLELAAPRMSRVGIALAAFAVLVSSVVVAVMIGARGSPVVSEPDFTSQVEPAMSTLVPEDLPVALTDPRAHPPANAGAATDAAEAEGEDAGATVRAKVTPMHPPRPWPRPTTPHITSKPRY